MRLINEAIIYIRSFVQYASSVSPSIRVPDFLILIVPQAYIAGVSVHWSHFDNVGLFWVRKRNILSSWFSLEYLILPYSTYYAARAY